MKKVVVSNANYELSVDGEKNRLYILCKGFWAKAEVVDQYAADQATALSQVKSGFTVVADMRELKTLPLDLVPKQQETQVALAQAGMFKVAEIVPQSAIAKSQLGKVTKSSNMPKMEFADYAEAEAWLDAQTKN
ncbi:MULTISPECIES: hypothetical protein [unclassified Carboxylicivirga]|uniref:hypothetical protein n=1 Tax=Carboxylicivirga TaxID=1628153 RepID=UPI003D358AFF